MNNNVLPADQILTGSISGSPELKSDVVFLDQINGGEILRIAADGFYVRGKKLEQDETEARKVYEAMTGWLKTTMRL